MTTIYLHADRSDNGDYSATEIVKGKLEDFLSNYEYGDVAEGQFQIWEYPSGKIFAIEADRKVPGGEYYTTPRTTEGVMWLPKLVHLTTDKKKVSLAHDHLKSLSQRKGIFVRLHNKLNEIFR